MMLKPEYARQFKRDIKMCEKRNYNMEHLKSVVRLLLEQKALPEKNKDHYLQGDYVDHRECHIAPDWLLIYKYVSSDVVVFSRTGTHSDLF